ncbi:J domain-containing protein [Plasmodiophora brassicae]|uniref:J domain-containing protein n=1 Tax=Plasmodiophora brassicae TaxID=37360 RepID=A0A0G4IY24_PLABS|nr:hypothetical protein PBRA_007710 [Plasmodiophora brassicae]SPQ99016.1 unnamed protein product [Plasmodiophora brassicae]
MATVPAHMRGLNVGRGGGLSIMSSTWTGLRYPVIIYRSARPRSYRSRPRRRSRMTAGSEDRLRITGGGDPQDDLPDLGDMFSVRRPKHALAGLSSGLKNVGKGLVGGVAAMVAMPVQGAREDGIKGFSKGLALGAVSGVALALAGATTGVVQVGRGILNTPGAIKGSMSEQVWDSEKREWIWYNLPEEADRVLKQADPNVADANKVVADTTLYDQLGVLPGCSQADIKRAYRHRAMELHPDKNPNDERANEKFQQLGAAYQVLSDEQLRAAYDAHGKTAVDESALFDSAQLFEVIFGSQNFEKYIGELKLLDLKNRMDGVDMSGNEDDQAVAFEEAMARALSASKDRQRRREVQCAVNLAEKLNEYLTDETDGHLMFKAVIENEAKELASTAFGGTLIGVLGYVYEEQAASFLGFQHGVSAGMGLASVRKSAHVLATKYRVMTSAFKAYRASRRAQDEEEKRSTQNGDRPPTSAPDEEGMDAILQTMWNLTVLDVESTSRNVCQKLFKDSSIPLEDRRERARGLLMMAKIFQACSQTAQAGLVELKAKFVAADSMRQGSQ